MEFRILGPLEVVSGAQPVPLGGGRQRAVLALLLLRPNEVVSTERLVEELWPGGPPATATKIVQLYVSRLRKRLDDGVLLTRPPGYVLRIAPERLDAHRAERLFEEGGRALAAREAGLAAATLRDALALWRGPPLADFVYEPFAQTPIARLEELRLATLEERIEADLALGRHAELAGELEAVVAEQPLRERPRAQLMLALYRSGRQAEALAAYQEARSVLVEELGIDPSPPLQRLETAILRQDAALDLPGAATEPPDTANDASGLAPSPGREVAEQAGERKLATALFADLVGSTALGEQDPERARAVLERFYDAMAGEIEAAGGTVEKFAGDAVMAVFGAPAAHEDHAERALHAALAMRARLEELFGDKLALRIGLDTGEVVAGRARQRSSFVTGSSVNAAARLEQAAAPGEILAGERTAAAARGAFEFGEPTTVEAKGKPGGLSCRRLVRALSLARPRGVSGLQRAFVGREGELELLQATFRRAVRGREPHLVTVIGGAGVGKTALVHEHLGQLEGELPEPRRLTGRCLAYGRGITYWPLGEILRQELGLLESDPPETVRRRLGAREILGITLGLDAGEVHPLEARERLHAAWVELLDGLVAERPAVLLIEDLHWAEEPLFDLLERLLQDVHGPLALLGTARPELLARRPAWAGGRRNAATLWLEPLSPDESARLVETLLGAELPPELAELVLARAEGNPFFVEELLATLIDTGVLDRENGGWIARERPSGLTVPDSVHAALASRIDLLPSAAKATLQAASVFGRVFWAGPVAELLGEEPDLAPLEERDFVRRSPSSSIVGEREYAIKHALTRDVAYASLPKARRARLHAACAAWLERVGERRDEHASLLAHHYAEAVRPEDADLAWASEEEEHARLRALAVAWLRRAADVAVAQGGFPDAVALLEQALELETSPARQAELWQALGHAHALMYDGDAFWTAMQHAIELSSDPLVNAETYSELALQTAYRFGMWKQRPDVGLVDGWIEQALDLAGSHDHPRAKALVARALLDPSNGGEAAREASEVAGRIERPELIRLAGAAQVEVAMAAQRHDEVLALVAEHLDLGPEIANPDEIAQLHWRAGEAHAARGRLEDARRHALFHDEIESRLSPHHRVHAVGFRLLVDELAGRWEAILALTPRTEQAVGANDTQCALSARSLLDCAVASACAGEDAEARRLELSADALAMEGYGTWVDAPRLRLALVRGDLGGVEQVLESAKLMNEGRLPALAVRLDALAALGDRDRVEEEAPPLVQPDTYLEPFALRALGIVREDEKLVEEALGRFEAMGLGWHAAETRRLM